MVKTATWKAKRDAAMSAAQSVMAGIPAIQEAPTAADSGPAGLPLKLGLLTTVAGGIMAMSFADKLAMFNACTKAVKLLGEGFSSFAPLAGLRGFVPQVALELRSRWETIALLLGSMLAVQGRQVPLIRAFNAWSGLNVPQAMPVIVGGFGSFAMKDLFQELMQRLERGVDVPPVVLKETYGMAYSQPNRVLRSMRIIGACILAALVSRRILSRVVSRPDTPIGATFATLLISRTLTADVLSSSQQRLAFNGMNIVRSKDPYVGHTHGVSAADRSSGTHTAILASQLVGKEPYFVQMSLSDARKGRDGDRTYHWCKDIAVPPVDFHFDCETQAAVLIDVDYYIDMPRLLAQHPGTYFIFACQPTEAAKSEGEYTFRFQEDGKLLYRVSGGAEYSHHVWDYSGDTCMAIDYGLLSTTVVSYHIDRKYIDDHHVLIMLSLIGKFLVPQFVPVSHVISGKQLQRLMPVFGQHVVLDIVTKEGQLRSVALQGDYNAVTLPRAQFDAVHAVAVVAKVPITPAMVASNVAPSSAVGLPTERLPPGHAAILASYLRSEIPRSPPVVYPPSECMLPIWFAKHDYTAPVPLAGFGSPLIGPCYGFAASIAADDRCIAGRVEAFANKDEDGDGVEVEKPIPPAIIDYMTEFAGKLIPHAHEGHPVDDEFVMEKQKRPQQRNILDEAGVTGDAIKAAWKSFVKKETYPKPTDPRNISQAHSKVKLDYAKLMYAFHKDVLAFVEWYAFNKTPKEIAERVCEILRDAGFAVQADASRFDGHLKRILRVLERLLLLRFFGRQYHSQVNEAMDQQIGLPGTTTEGRKYQSFYTRGSGSLETSDFNSVASAFIDYCALRNTLVNGVRLTADQAWAKLGIYGGDDSLSGAVDPDALKRSAKMLGQDYTIEVVRRGDAGVTFLNRQYGPDVWTGDMNSMSNPSRLLAKLFVGPKDLHDPLERFAERISGYYRMDQNSPVIGDITWVAHKLLGERADGLLMPWEGKTPLESNWPNEDSGWMTALFNRQIPDFDWDRFREHLVTVLARGDASLLLKFPLCTAARELPPVVKQACVVGDELCAPQPTVAQSDDDIDDKLVFGTMTLAAAIAAKESAPAVKVAEAAVPRLGADGTPKRERAKLLTEDEAKDPRNWATPTQRKEETAEKFAMRLSEWKKLRSKVAKRKGIPLDGKTLVGALGAGHKKGDGPEGGSHPPTESTTTMSRYNYNGGTWGVGAEHIKPCYTAADIEDTKWCSLCGSYTHFAEGHFVTAAELRAEEWAEEARIRSMLGDKMVANHADGKKLIGMMGAGASKGDGPQTRAQRRQRSRAAARKRPGRARQSGPRRRVPQSRDTNHSMMRRRAPVAYETKSAMRNPVIWSEGDKMCVRHREYVSDIFTDPENVFAYNIFAINPSNAALFPWLSRLATRFESYRLEELVVEYKGYSPSTTAGQVITAIDYDAEDPTGTATKAELLNTKNSVDTVMWGSSRHVSTAPYLNKVGPKKFVDVNVNDVNADVRLSSCGNLFVATSSSNVAPGSGVGELWVEYLVKLDTPILKVGGGRETFRSPSQVFSSWAGDGSSTTDAFPYPNTSVTRATTLGSSSPAGIALDEGIGSEAWGAGPTGAPAMQPGPYQFSVSGSPVPSSQSVIAFIADFAGRLVIRLTSGLANPMCAMTSAVIATCVKAGLPTGNLGVGGVPASYAFVDAIVAGGGGSPTGLASVIVDVVAAAGTGLVISVPSWTPNTNAYQMLFEAIEADPDLVFTFDRKKGKDAYYWPGTTAPDFTLTPPEDFVDRRSAASTSGRRDDMLTTFQELTGANAAPAPPRAAQAARVASATTALVQRK